MQMYNSVDESASNTVSYERSRMQKDMILQMLKKRGCRITKQRMMLLDIILEEDCSCCKEIYYKASKLDPKIGTATVYRMINTLEEIGAISRKNMYKVACGESCGIEDACVIELDDSSSIELSAKEWNRIIRAGLMAGGYIENQAVTGVSVKPCGCGTCC